MNDLAPQEQTGAAPALWHTVPPGAALRRLASNSDGLTNEEAERRLAQVGPNRLRPPQRKSPLMRFLLQFHNVLIYVLLAAGAITLAIHHWVDAGVIFGVVVINAIVGFLQEGKAERALDAIRQMLSLQATVVRDGARQTIAAEDIVPGDIVVLQSGDKVPADLRLIQTRGLQVQEAVLTGEAAPVGKDNAAVSDQTPLGDRSGMAYAGTFVSYGTATGVVVATGDTTEVGRIGLMLGEVESVRTPLMEQLSRFSQMLTILILVLTGLVSAAGVLGHGMPIDEMFLAAVGLAVAAIPEGLPAIVTITLAIGVQRMARRNAIIRRLPAVETLGSVNVICTDKTGTLTRNEMMVESIATPTRMLRVTGHGYAPEGSFTDDARSVVAGDDPVVIAALRAAVLCSDAGLHETPDGWGVVGDPTEGAALAAAAKAGLEIDEERAAAPRLDAIPFESQHKFMATLHRAPDGDGRLVVKGAPERVLAMCTHQATGSEDEALDPEAWHQRIAEIGRRGERVLAVASCSVPASMQKLTNDDVNNLTLLGLFGIADPPREEAVAAVARCRAAGITVKMITGDHRDTAIAIAAGIGLDHGKAMTGADLDDLDDDALTKAAYSAHVFARTTPAHKLRLVEALQRAGLTVAMTGDGVNDAPALKRADVGIAMGKRGTEAAKEAAQIVLADDNFASIAHAVEEGRTVYANLKKAILYLLVTNGTQALTIIVAVLLGQALPITAVQVLWVNMVTAVTLSLALAFEQPEPDVMQRPPRTRGTPLVSLGLLGRIAFVSAVMVGGVMLMFEGALAHGLPVEMARTIAVNALVGFEIVYLLAVRPGLAFVLSSAGRRNLRPPLTAIAVVSLLQLAFTYAPPMQALFETRSLTPGVWLAIGAASISVLIVIELEKTVLRIIRNNR
jgi:ATPase, P-type (transporting), HAD superfamily, subfamily IC